MWEPHPSGQSEENGLAFLQEKGQTGRGACRLVHTSPDRHSLLDLSNGQKHPDLIPAEVCGGTLKKFQK